MSEPEKKEKIACLCPTYMRPISTANSVALFNFQDYPEKRLYIYDDGFTFLEDVSDRYPNVKLKVTKKRASTLSEKYNTLLEWALEDYDPDIIVVWENDDLFLPNHLSTYANLLGPETGYEVLRLTHVFVYNPLNKSVFVQFYQGVFHGSLAFRASLAKERGVRWPDTAMAYYDLIFLNNVLSGFKTHYADVFPTYIFRFPCTETVNGETLSRGPTDTTWYERYGERYPSNDIEAKRIPLEARFDPETEYFYDVFVKPGLLQHIYLHYKKTGKHLMKPW